jgi:MFS transporter, DHA1 family, multidrug resistance protein
MRNSKILILFFTMVVMMLGFGIIIPILPFYVEQFGAGGDRAGHADGCFQHHAVYLCPHVGQPLGPVRSQAHPAGCALGNGLSMLLFGLSNGLPMMFLSRILAGMLFISHFADRNGLYIGQHRPAQPRRRDGDDWCCHGDRMVLGPGLGGWLGGRSLSTPFFLAASLSIVAMLIIWFVLPESLPPEKRRVAERKFRGPRVDLMWRALFGPLGFLLFLAFLVNFGLANFEGIFGLYAKNRYGYGPGQVGTILTMIGLISALIQGLVTGPATRALGEVKVIKLCLVGSALGFAMMLLARQYTVILMTVGFFVFSNAMLRPSIASLISNAPREAGAALGMSSGFESLGRVVGPLYAGSVFDLNMSLPYSSAALIMLASFIFSLVWLRQQHTPVEVLVVESAD